jgi:hypothetical protein
MALKIENFTDDFRQRPDLTEDWSLFVADNKDRGVALRPAERSCAYAHARANRREKL